MPSVSQLPLIGQEGMEYASLEEAGSSPEQEHKKLGNPTYTRNIAGDLPLHAPKASLAPVTARDQIAPVTRTDSSAAADADVGKAHSDYDEPDSPNLRRTISRGADRQVSNHSPDLSRSTSRRASVYGTEHEHGIPEIGLQVPMYPNAGDVQAPSPGPGAAMPSTGVGFFNNSSQASVGSASRRKSTQGFHVPPGSYGLHGHGVQQHDKFEKSWYQKHPEEAAKEKQGAYGPGLGAQRSEWAMSSEELNKLVREHRGIGFGKNTIENTLLAGTDQSQLLRPQ